MAYSNSVLLELAATGVTLKIISPVTNSILSQLVDIAVERGSKIEIGFSVVNSVALELARRAPNNIVIVH